MDVYQEEHYETERTKLKTFKRVIAVISVVFLAQLFIPFLYLSDGFRDILNLEVYEHSKYRQGSILFEILLLFIIVFWTIFAVTSVLVNVRSSYIDAYRQHRVEYIEMGVVIGLSSMTMIILDILKVLSEECIHNDQLHCSDVLEFPSSQYGLLIDFIAKSVPGIAFMYVNRPKDFIIDYNKYPDNITHVSIIQYHNHGQYYQSAE